MVRKTKCSDSSLDYFLCEFSSHNVIVCERIFYVNIIHYYFYSLVFLDYIFSSFHIMISSDEPRKRENTLPSYRHGAPHYSAYKTVFYNAFPQKKLLMLIFFRGRGLRSHSVT